MFGETRREGVVEGMDKGSYAKAIKTAKNCLALNLPFETIAKIMGFSREEIERLKNTSRKVWHNLRLELT